MPAEPRTEPELRPTTALRFSRWERWVAGASGAGAMTVSTWLGFTQDGATSAVVAGGSILVAAAFGYAAVSGQPLTGFKLPGGGEAGVEPYARLLEDVVRNDDVSDEVKRDIGQDAAEAGIVLPPGARREVTQADSRWRLASTFELRTLQAATSLPEVVSASQGSDVDPVDYSLTELPGMAHIGVIVKWINPDSPQSSRRLREARQAAARARGRHKSILVIVNIPLSSHFLEQLREDETIRFISWSDETDTPWLHEAIRALFRAQHIGDKSS